MSEAILAIGSAAPGRGLLKILATLFGQRCAT